MTLLLCILLPLSVLAQSTTTGHTPSGFAAGSPSGTYALSGFDTINYFNGNISFELPLHTVTARGTAGYAITLGLNAKWSVREELDQGQLKYYPYYNDWPTFSPGYSPGIMIARNVAVTPCQGAIGSSNTITRLTFMAADGTETELSDTTAANGTIQPSQCTFINGYSRGTTFTSRDGSAMTFISDSTIFDSPHGSTTLANLTGWLIFRDGTRYRIEESKVKKIQDRNGNYVTLEYSANRVISITDSIKRLVTIDYEQSDPTYGTHDKITLNRGGGINDRIIRVSKVLLSTALHSGSSPIFFETLFPTL